jgi:hypothetical protein
MPQGETPGLWSFQPSEALLQDLDALFDGQSMSLESYYV